MAPVERDTQLSERLTRLEERHKAHRTEFNSFREEMMGTMTEIRNERAETQQLLSEVRTSINSISEKPKAIAWWTEKLLTIIIAVAGLLGILYAFNNKASAAPPLPEDFVQKIAEESAKRAAEEMAKQQRPRPGGSVAPATMTTP